MTRLQRGCVILSLALVSPALCEAGEEGPQADLQPVLTDSAAVALLLEESGVDQRPPAPSLSDWFTAVMNAVNDWIADRLAEDQPLLESILGIAMWVVIGLVPVLVIAGALLVVAALRRGPARTSGSVGDKISATGTSLLLEAREPEQCWLELEQALAEGRVRAATVALWWWLALTLTGDAAQAWWSSGDLLRRTRRHRDLGPSLAMLDSVVYGRETPGADTIRCIAAHLRDAV